MEKHLWILQIYSPTLMPFMNQNQWGISSYPHISLVKFAIAFVSGNWSWCWVLETGTACDDTSLFIKSPTNTASSAHLSLWSASNSPSVPIRSEYCISVAPIQFLQAISQMSIYMVHCNAFATTKGKAFNFSCILSKLDFLLSRPL